MLLDLAPFVKTARCANLVLGALTHEVLSNILPYDDGLALRTYDFDLRAVVVQVGHQLLVRVLPV